MKENHDIEWKESWREDYLKWVRGIANAEEAAGGRLVGGM